MTKLPRTTILSSYLLTTYYQTVGLQTALKTSCFVVHTRTYLSDTLLAGC